MYTCMSFGSYPTGLCSASVRKIINFVDDWVQTHAIPSCVNDFNLCPLLAKIVNWP